LTQAAVRNRTGESWPRLTWRDPDWNRISGATESHRSKLRNWHENQNEKTRNQRVEWISTSQQKERLEYLLVFTERNQDFIFKQVERNTGDAKMIVSWLCANSNSGQNRRNPMAQRNSSNPELFEFCGIEIECSDWMENNESFIRSENLLLIIWLLFCQKISEYSCPRAKLCHVREDVVAAMTTMLHLWRSCFVRSWRVTLFLCNRERWSSLSGVWSRVVWWCVCNRVGLCIFEWWCIARGADREGYIFLWSLAARALLFYRHIDAADHACVGPVWAGWLVGSVCSILWCFSLTLCARFIFVGRHAFRPSGDQVAAHARFPT
jgi:hypothetical protein